MNFVVALHEAARKTTGSLPVLDGFSQPIYSNAGVVNIHIEG